MAGESTTLRTGRNVSGYVDMNYPEPFICRPVGGSVPSGGSAQWSTPATTAGTASAYATLQYTTNYQGSRSGLIDGIKTGGIVEFGIVVGVKSSQGTPSAGIRLKARNASGSWVQIDDGGLDGAGKFALTTTELEKSYSGYFPTVDAFNAVPFDLSVECFSDNATSLAIFRVKNSSYVKGIVWPKG